VEEITEILSDAHSLPRWWPEVYLAVRESEPGLFALTLRIYDPKSLIRVIVASSDPKGAGSVIRLIFLCEIVAWFEGFRNAATDGPSATLPQRILIGS
jgi:hypothetical protein